MGNRHAHRTMRRQIQFVARIAGLEIDGRRRDGVHAERGEESVEHMIRLYAGHDLLHLEQLARIRRAVTQPAQVTVRQVAAAGASVP
jgi:hypothetical protein